MVFVKDVRKCPICEKKGLFLFFEGQAPDFMKINEWCSNDSFLHGTWHGQHVLVKLQPEELEYRQGLVLT